MNINDFSKKTEYFEQIFENQKELSKKIIIKDYFPSQPINNHMRHILIDWLWDVKLHFDLGHDTFFICCSVLDRFMSNIIFDIQIKDYQLYGIVSLLLAAKINEIYPPELRDLKYITDNAYSIQRIKQQEIQMCNNIDHFIPNCTVFYFVELLILKYKLKEQDQNIFFDLALVSILCFYEQCQFNNFDVAVSLLKIINHENKYTIEEEHNEACCISINKALKKIKVLNKSKFDKIIQNIKRFMSNLK
tara:strand:+ start:25 stop:765 length:741 start_codon:yes stop_codon:yes gene_type:complete